MKKKQKPFHQNSTPLIFIHGIKGGILKDQNSGDIKWLNLKQAFNFSSPDLKLPLEWTTGNPPFQKEDNLISGGSLDKITLIPGIIEEKIYHELLVEAPQKYSNFYSFSYDWRRSNLDSVEKYLVFLREIVKKHNRPVKIIAHSMGGMLTMAAMQREPELFESVFFVGVPFAGGVGFLKDLQVNTFTGLNKQIVSPEVLATMPSVYSLFPIKATSEISDGAKTIPINFYNSEDWQKLKMGPFTNSFSDNDRFKKHFSNSLLVAKLFREQMTEGELLSNGHLKTKQPKVYLVLNKSLPTLVQVIKKGDKWDFKSAPKELGDGRVAAKDAYPPKGIVYKEFESKSNHENLLNDKSTLDWIFSQK